MRIRLPLLGPHNALAIGRPYRHCKAHARALRLVAMRSACSANVGNAMPRAEDMAAWIPKGGGGYDIVAVGMQEST